MFLSLLSIRLSEPPYSLPIELQLKLFGYFSLNEIAELQPSYDLLVQLSINSPPARRSKKTVILSRNNRFNWESTDCPKTAWFAVPFVLFQYFFDKNRTELISTLEYVPIGIEYPLINLLLSEKFLEHLDLIFAYGFEI
jgi:hypothetical protein